MQELIFGKSINGKADKMLTNEISVSEGRCSVNIFEVLTQHEIGEPVPDRYAYHQLDPDVKLTFYNKKSLIAVIAALRDSLEQWDKAEIDAEINNLRMIRERIKSD